MKHLLELFSAAPYNRPDAVPQVAVDQTTLANILNVVYAIGGAIAVVFVVLGGIQYSLSGGDAGKVKQAKDTILYALIGLAVVMVAFGITRFVIGAV